MRVSMQTRNAARVLPDPVGADTRTSRPSRMRGQPWIWGSVGAPRRVANHSATRGSKEDSTTSSVAVGGSPGRGGEGLAYGPACYNSDEILSSKRKPPYG